MAGQYAAWDAEAVIVSVGLRPAAGPQRAFEPPDGLFDVNPLRDPDNCVSCAIAGDATLGGAPACAIACGPRHVSEIRIALGGLFRPVTGRAEIERLLQDAGPGARGIVYASRDDGITPGHTFNAINRGGVIWFIDFQIARPATFYRYTTFSFLLTARGGWR